MPLETSKNKEHKKSNTANGKPYKMKFESTFHKKLIS